jgi:3-oxoacyl-[acyl-carrier protein] reductase
LGPDGFTATDRLLELAGSLAASEGITPKEIEEAWAAQAPLKRVGRPEESANAVVFLASECASYITGVSLAVDGGVVKSLY